jgi:hypothetical protein
LAGYRRVPDHQQIVDISLQLLGGCLFDIFRFDREAERSNILFRLSTAEFTPSPLLSTVSAEVYHSFSERLMLILLPLHLQRDVRHALGVLLLVSEPCF